MWRGVAGWLTGGTGLYLAHAVEVRVEQLVSGLEGRRCMIIGRMGQMLQACSPMHVFALEVPSQASRAHSSLVT